MSNTETTANTPTDQSDSQTSTAQLSETIIAARRSLAELQDNLSLHFSREMSNLRGALKQARAEHKINQEAKENADSNLARCIATVKGRLIASMIHAAIAAFMAVYNLPELWEQPDRIKSSTPMSWIAVCLSSGYFFAVTLDEFFGCSVMSKSERFLALLRCTLFLAPHEFFSSVMLFECAVPWENLTRIQSLVCKPSSKSVQKLTKFFAFLGSMFIRVNFHIIWVAKRVLPLT